MAKTTSDEKQKNQGVDARTFSAAEELKDAMIAEAVMNKASDVHIDPTEQHLLIRFRIDGVLHVWTRRPQDEYDTFISHLKVLSGLDIAHRATPQEGYFAWVAPSSTSAAVASGARVLAVRSSFFPTVHGEAVVLRLLNRVESFLNLSDLGFGAEDLGLVRSISRRSHGMVLVSGPAGTGKTTTLYSILRELAGESRTIITLEDPVEYYLDFVRQSQVSPHTGYTFAVGIRSILRQDPDSIMVGEIRDYETAENAIRASLTGRLLLSTLHANSAIGTITRLIDMKIERDMVAYALSGVIGQRLVKKICGSCREAYQPSEEIRSSLGIDRGASIVHGAGCEVCFDTGYSSRVGIFEVLDVDGELQRMIINNASAAEIEEVAHKKGLKTLREDGLKKVYAGITTPEEVLRASM
ncbi:MAG: GspE/PulE family protein [bacterium]|nr:GspE/PulE family protein [bacterium]